MGWVHGGGTAVGMLAEMLAAGLNANLGGRDQMPIEVERQIVEWARAMFSFPVGATGVFVTGTSTANLLAVLIARTAALGREVRQTGVAAKGGKLRAYTSADAHVCITQAMEISGLGSGALRRIPVDASHRMDVSALRHAIADDRAKGLTPFLVAGTAGTVDTGAVDDLVALADLCAEEHMYFHIDGAFGALAVWSDELAPLVKGIERADSIAFDFHKWAQVPYDAGFLLARDGKLHRATFASPAAYLRREARGLAAGSPWPSEFGPDLSRGFRALKTWFTLKTFGTDRMGAVLARTCELAKYLEHRVQGEPCLELLAPVALNIVCFRHRGDDALNARIVVDLHEIRDCRPIDDIYRRPSGYSRRVRQPPHPDARRRRPGGCRHSVRQSSGVKLTFESHMPTASRVLKAPRSRSSVSKETDSVCPRTGHIIPSGWRPVA